jgi:signal transduction histidine kinase
MGRGRSAWVAASLLVLAAASAKAAEAKRVLFLHSFGPDIQAEDAFADNLRTDLARKSPYPLDRHEVSLEIARFSEGGRGAAFVGFLKGLFDPPDLVLAMVGGLPIVALLLSQRRLRRVHEQLKASEERMNLAAAAGNLRFWVWEIPRDEVWASASEWNSGNWYSAEPMTFDQFVAITHRDDRALLRQAVQSALSGDGEYRAEFRVPLPDSTIRYISARGRVDFDGVGKPIRLRGVSIDITERRRVEEEARDLSGRLITAQEDERARLGRALHDDVTQRLALAAFEVGRRESSVGDAATKQVLRSLRSILTRLSEDVHAISYSLHPAILQDLGLIEALKAECERFSSVEPIPVRFRAEEIFDEPPQPTALCLYRVAQEALRNAARHAFASAIEVRLRFVDGGLQLSVHDNGVGFDPALKPVRPSLGHASMRQRVSLVRGELYVDSEPGHGTTVLAWAPLNKEAHRESSASVTGR